MEVVQIGKAAPNSALVEDLERLLEMAKSGELRTLIWVGDMRKGGVHRGWSSMENRFEMLGFLARAMHGLQIAMDRDAEAVG